MPFRYVLGNLLAAVEEAVGVLFLDDSGETIDLACAHDSPFEIKVIGAYLGIYLSRLHELSEQQGIGTTNFLHIERRGLHVYAHPIEDGYFLALVQRRGGLVGRARAALGDAAERLREELFAPR